MSAAHHTGTVRAGDVTLFYRRFGVPGAAPILILHGANYFDSSDWVSVAQALAREREVVAFDQRGFGESTWSPSKNYSNDASIADMLALLDALGWKRCALLGHSRGGTYATLFASRFPERTAGLMLADYAPGAEPRGAPAAVNSAPKVFPTIQALQSAMSRDKNTPPGSAAHARLQSFIKAVAGGFIVSKRDPDFAHPRPIQDGPWEPRYAPVDMWQELAAVRAPIQLLRGSKSDRVPAAAFARMQNELKQVDPVELDCGHDLAAGAPDALVAAVGRFLALRVDPGARS